MKVSELRIGDRVKITSVPGEGVVDYCIEPETVRAYKKLIARKRFVTISEIDEDGHAWYEARFRLKNNKLEHHFFAIFEEDNNWRLISRNST